MGTETKMTVRLMLCVPVAVGTFFTGVGAASVLGCEKASVDVTISLLRNGQLRKCHSRFISGSCGVCPGVLKICKVEN